MEDTTELVREALRTEAAKHGIIDEAIVDLIDHSKVSVKDGQPAEDDVKALVQAMRRSKPTYFKVTDAAKLSPEHFEELTDRLRQRQSLAAPNKPAGLNAIDAAELSTDEMRSLHAVITNSGSSYDRSVVAACAKRQGVSIGGES